MPGLEDSEDSKLLTACVRQAGTIAKKYFGGRYKTWDKGRGDPVTEADIEIDHFLKETLLAARPAYGWLSEESLDDRLRLNRTRTFVVDPIDGTHGFVKGRPQFTIVAAVVEAGRPVAAAIYNPITDEMFEAMYRGGTRLNGIPVHVSAKSDFSGARFLATRRFLDPAHWTTPWVGSVSVENRSSIAYRMALIATGAFDAMVSLSAKSDWDIAAGDLIVQEAGGRATDESGATFIYNREVPVQGSVVCAGAALHGRLLARLKEHIP